MMASTLRPSPVPAQQRSHPSPSCCSQSTPRPLQPRHPLTTTLVATAAAAATLLLNSSAWATSLPSQPASTTHAPGPSGQALFTSLQSPRPQSAPLLFTDARPLAPSQAPSAGPQPGAAHVSYLESTGLRDSEVYVRGWGADDGLQAASASTSAWAADRPWAPPPPRRPQPAAAGSSSAASAAQVQQALSCLQAARQAVDQGQYSQALEQYNYIIQQYPDFALSEYARVGRAMVLYQVGQTSDAILALEDESVAMVGSAEIHAALAALLYTERPGLAFRAEEEWEIASSFDKRYADMEFVRSGKHWPERLVAALEKFLSMQS